MTKIMSLMCVILMLVQSHSTEAAIYWVGDLDVCTVDNARSSLGLALLSAALSPEDDEIRLSNTVSYLGGGNIYNLIDFDPSTTGRVTIKGGYANCFNAIGGPTFIGNVSGDVFTVKTSSQNSSVVTFDNVHITQAEGRGIVVEGGGEVTLNHMAISLNDQGGVKVSNGGYLNVNANTNIFNNGLPGSESGGGIRCTGSNSNVDFFGSLLRNRAGSGGNMYLSTGCFAMLHGGSSISGSNTATIDNAASGGGIFVFNGGTLFSDGDQDRVIIENHRAEFGGGLYVWGSGRATLLNTVFENNISTNKGSAIYAINGGSQFSQILMDRVQPCPFLITCSAINQNQYNDSLVYVDNSYIQINRTVIDSNRFVSSQPEIRGMIKVVNGGLAELNRLGMTRNDAEYLLFVDSATADMTHVTGARNSFVNGNNQTEDSLAVLSNGQVEVQNSVFADSGGVFIGAGGSINGDCNLTDNMFGWPNGTFSSGTAQFNSVDTGDARQIASSPGVDMCLQDSNNWSSEIDIEHQNAPVNENTNPQGSPGQIGGLYDAGFDEVYDNIGEDEFLLTVQKEGSGAGSVVSTPLGIACGSDCSEVFFRGTLVTLFANASSGSDFAGWRACPLPNGNQCLISVIESDTVFAEFLPNDLIFADDFE